MSEGNGEEERVAGFHVKWARALKEPSIRPIVINNWQENEGKRLVCLFYYTDEENDAYLLRSAEPETIITMDEISTYNRFASHALNLIGQVEAAKDELQKTREQFFALMRQREDS